MLNSGRRLIYMKETITKIVGLAGYPFRSLSRKNWIVMTIAAVAGMSVFLIWTTAPRPEVLDAKEESWAVTTLVAAPGLTSPQIALYGRVETPRTAMLTASVHAYVCSVPAMEGQMVEKDRVLVVLDDTDVQLTVDRCQADVQEAQASLGSLQIQNVDNREILNHEKELYELKQKDVQRYIKLRAKNSISDQMMSSILRESHHQAISLQTKSGVVKDFENRFTRGQARLQRAQATLREAETLLKRTVVRAPFGGRITRVYPAPGERVSVGTNLVEMYDTAALEIRAQIPLRILPGLQRVLEGTDPQSLKAWVRTDDGVLASHLDRLSGKVSSGQSGIDGLFIVPGASEKLVLGRAVNLILNLPQEAGVVAVPIQSIYGENRIYLASDGRLQGVTVERLGEVTDDTGHFNVLVRAPEIKSGDQIVTTQLSNAITGLKVSINDSASTDSQNPAQSQRIARATTSIE